MKKVIFALVAFVVLLLYFANQQLPDIEPAKPATLAPANQPALPSSNTVTLRLTDVTTLDNGNVLYTVSSSNNLTITALASPYKLDIHEYETHFPRDIDTNDVIKSIPVELGYATDYKKLAFDFSYNDVYYSGEISSPTSNKNGLYQALGGFIDLLKQNLP